MECEDPAFREMYLRMEVVVGVPAKIIRLNKECVD